jgi:hypothetical protein
MVQAPPQTDIELPAFRFWLRGFTGEKILHVVRLNLMAWLKADPA